MSRLLRVLVAGLVIVLLPAVTACGEQTDLGQTATPEPSAASEATGPVDDPNELIDRVVALLEETNALDAQNQELMMKALEIDPEGKDAADALPMLADVEAGYDEMTKNQETIAALLGEVAELDAGEELKTYADQQKEIAEIQIEMYAGWKAVVAMHKKMLPLWSEASELSEAEVAKSQQEYYDTYALLDEPGMRLEKAWYASWKYFKHSGLAKRYFINNGVPEEELPNVEGSEEIPAG